ncbi:uncharacterized protein Ecym_5017 [Eremothecium cymbalariae DBVPG|uniref:Zn(2)-C6 fungal-type domain-containing protein n=1 Tax=Eremothecium cymbalariae (strain CBS 270.75 / DBVPG 7215 / KCTC 17166 / NRRL Y-17582) TaxID=931890 RepID=I6NCM6_ERECY|nr:hypothetical protein Ecym_5017 [Eremothecium cymbalariae DBVPG\
MAKPEDMSGEQFSAESPERKYVSKRNRISFVCQACRKSKTKCDREKPRCSRCAKNNIKCVYDIEKQSAPRVPSKDATIKRLTQELEYWKKKAARYMDMEESGQLSPGRRPKSSSDLTGRASSSDLHVLSDDFTSSQDSSADGKRLPRPDEILINFYDQAPQLLIKDSMKRDVKASCELSQVRHDRFLSIFLSSVFASASKNALIHSIPSDDAPAFFDRTKRKQNAMALRDAMFQMAASDKDREQLIQFTDRISQGNMLAENRTGFYIRMFTSTLYKNYVEDRCPKEAIYSDTLKDLIVRIEMFLPPLTDVRTYMAHFYKFVYPIVPFLEMDLFEASLAEILQEDPSGNGRIKLNIGHEHIRSKIETIAILLIVMKLSYISMTFSNPSVDYRDSSINKEVFECLTSYPISDEAVTLSQKAIASVNLFNWTNENCVTCLLYLWAFFVFAPQDGDFCLGQPTEVILSLVNSMAINIGLHRDPSKYEQLNDPTVSDPKLRNYRRKLWICIFIACRYEASLRGKHPQSMQDHSDSFLNSEFPQQYMESVFSDLPDADPYTVMIHSLTFKRYQLLLMMSELDEISIHSRYRLPLGRIESQLENVRNFLEREVPSDLTDFENESEFLKLSSLSGRDEIADIMKIKKVVFMQAYMITRLSVVRTVINLMLYFERLTSESGKEYMPYFQKYFLLMVKETILFIEMLLKHFDYKSNDPYFLHMKYSTDKVAQLCVSSVLLPMLSIILRMVHSQYLLQKMLQSGEMIGVEDIHVTKQKLDLISTIYENNIDILEMLCTVVTRKLGFTYFSVFQMLIFFDYCNQIIRKGEVLNIFSRITQLTYHPKIRVGIYQGFGIDVDKKDTILKFLNDATFIKQTNIQHLKKLKEFSGKIPKKVVDVFRSEGTNDVKFSMQPTPARNDHHTFPECNNLPFPVTNDNTQALNMTSNVNDTGQPFGGDLQNFAAVQLDSLVSFDDLDLLDYEFLFGNSG